MDAIFDARFGSRAKQTNRHLKLTLEKIKEEHAKIGGTTFTIFPIRCQRKFFIKLFNSPNCVFFISRETLLGRKDMKELAENVFYSVHMFSKKTKEITYAPGTSFCGFNNKLSAFQVAFDLTKELNA